MAEAVVLAGSWEDCDTREAACAVRRAVFIEEQGVPEELEWDDDDARSVHFIARTADGTAVGAARLLPDGHIGRMAVLQPHRGRGIGAALLTAAVEEAVRRGHPFVRLNAQTHALPFYCRYGFVPHGPEFMDAGIPHRAMERRLTV